MTEERMDDRLKMDQGVSRRSRGMDDRKVTEDRVMSDDERLEMFRMNLYNDALPIIPEIPNYHVCWLTTTNKSDTIQQRLRLGYELIKGDDVPVVRVSALKALQGDAEGQAGVVKLFTHSQAASASAMLL